ncbi:hypothetical protein Vadar_000515 [Vaccinium darrowii]|uniref:Uncharacterized protein n=1 Tax=Vaccinium darrowii TaxID=229202 RepID=A0ACB7XNB4_9ERIC|nr:hypothetical protein Vadar_000515 [Vaccinium darrowii]
MAWIARQLHSAMLLGAGICLVAQQEVIEPTITSNANGHSKKPRTFMGEKDKGKILRSERGIPYFIHAIGLKPRPTVGCILLLFDSEKKLESTEQSGNSVAHCLSLSTDQVSLGYWKCHLKSLQ